MGTVLRLQVIDIDYFLVNGKPTIRIFGRQGDGSSACCFVEGIKPYFYIEKNTSSLKVVEGLGLEFEEVERKTAIGYQCSFKEMLKIYVSNPQDIPKLRNELEKYGRCYEADIPFKYRFMIDKGIRGMGWIECEVEPIRTVASNITSYKVLSIKPIEMKDDVQLRILSFDIECLQLDFNRAPDAERDPIVVIAMAFFPAYNGKQNLVLASKSIPGTGLVCSQGEREMFEQFVKIILDYDPDIVTGYNINSFDIPYMLTRFRKLGVGAFFGKADKGVRLREFIGGKDVEIVGRVVADVYQLLKRDVNIRLQRYDLRTASKELLREDKGDVKYSDIRRIWIQEPHRLVEYARQDAMLALRLLLDLRMMNKFIEIARISGPLLQDCLHGQTTRIEIMLFHEFYKRGMLMPCKPTGKEMSERLKQDIKGGFVVEPEKGLHTNNVLVLDFQSLYPSIICAFNISPDTLLIGDPNDKISFHTTPNGSRFVDSKVYTGVFPSVIKSLLEARQSAKKAMINASEDERRALDARQLALKILANAFYGYCGYARARLYISDVANAITSYGRDNINKTKNLIESNFPHTKIIYGDTDSLFVKIDEKDIEKAYELGERISSFVSASGPGLRMEFEKIYRSFLILTKKRYAGWKWTKSKNGWNEKIDMRGIETVRRDWCPLVSEVLLAVLNTILKENDINKAKTIVRETISELAAGKISLDKLTIIKGIQKTLDGYKGVQPHIELAKKMRSRDPRASPIVGERIGYVIVRGNGLLSNRAEDPEWVRERGLQIDFDYYLNSQLLPPVLRIFEVLGIEESEIMGGGKQSSLIDVVSTSTISCDICGRQYRRVPLNGICECGSNIK